MKRAKDPRFLFEEISILKLVGQYTAQLRDPDLKYNKSTLALWITRFQHDFSYRQKNARCADVL